MCWLTCNRLSYRKPPLAWPFLRDKSNGRLPRSNRWNLQVFASPHLPSLSSKPPSGYSAFLNGNYIGSFLGSTSITNGTLTLSFSNATLSHTNVLFIIQDHTGHDETSGVTNPRGIYNATLLGPISANSSLSFDSWKLAGTAGGETNIDPVRGPYNEGGLHAERMGWHLPGFNDHAWSSSAPEIGLSEAGAKFYRSVVKLDVPKGVDVCLGFVLGSKEGSKVRAHLYVNGYMFGKFVPWIGNQVVFPGESNVLEIEEGRG